MLGMENLIKLFANNQPKQYLGDYIDTNKWSDVDTMVDPERDFVEQIKDWSNEKLCTFIILSSEHPRTPAGCYDYAYDGNRKCYEFMWPDRGDKPHQLLEHSEVQDLANILAMARGIIPLMDSGC